MLGSSKDVMLANLKLHALQIRSQELDYYSKALSAVASGSSLFASFAYSRLTATIPDTVDDTFAAFFYAFTAFVWSMCMINTIVSTYATMYGPGLALRGPDAQSMDDAVEGMRAMKNRLMKSYRVVFVSFFASAVMYIWMVYKVKRPHIAIVITFVLGGTVLAYYWYSWYIRDLFFIPRDLLASSRGLSELEALAKDADEDTLAAKLGLPPQRSAEPNSKSSSNNSTSPSITSPKWWPFKKDAQAPQTMCSRCGNPLLTADAAFCTSCGHSQKGTTTGGVTSPPSTAAKGKPNNTSTSKAPVTTTNKAPATKAPATKAPAATNTTKGGVNCKSCGRALKAGQACPSCWDDLPVHPGQAPAQPPAKKK